MKKEAEFKSNMDVILLNIREKFRKTIYSPLIIVILMLLLQTNNSVTALQPTNCSLVDCPPLSTIVCPDDSLVRETNEETNVIASNDHYEIVKEVFIQCCVTQKCACRTCNIPSCHNSSLVLMELQPETEIPGKCCGEYACNFEPNCSEILDTEHYWLTDCKRCKCNGGKKECLIVCDELMSQMTPHRSLNNQINNINNNHINNINNNYSNSDEDFGNCYSKALNEYFLSGQKWKEDNNCTLCECFGQHAKCEDICNIPPSTIITNHETLTDKTCFSNRLNKKFNHGSKWEEDNCTLCQCHNGANLCENNCENLLIERIGPSNCISNNRSFENEESWTEDNGCSDCKCENGEKHCQTSLCQQLNCKKHIKIPGKCCSQCIVDNDNATTTIIPAILTETENPLSDTNDNNNSTPIIIIPKYVAPSSTIESVSISDEPIDSISESITETESEIPTSQTPIFTTFTTTKSIATYDVKNERVNESVSSVEQQSCTDCSHLYWVITVLALVAMVFLCGLIILWRKRSNNSRSYDPVSRTDDNFNKVSIIPSYKHSYENEKEKINQNGKENEK